MSKDTKKPSAFVIMPFAPEFNDIYSDLIKPALEEAGYDVSRADSDLHQENILRKIIKGITRAELVIAELTTLNPNVLYELGLSHALGVPTVLLAQSIEQVPFDLRSYNIQLYSTHFGEVKKLKGALKEIGEKHLTKQVIFGNPITDFAPQSISVYPSANNANQALLDREESSLLQEDQGILEATLASQELARVMIALAEEINKSVNKISPLLTAFDNATRDFTPGKSQEAQQLAEQISSELDRSSSHIENYLPEIEKNIKTPFQVFLQYLSLLDAEDQQDKQQLVNFRGMFVDLLEKVPLGLKGLKSYRKSVAQIGLRSGTMGPASRRNMQAVEKITDSMEQVQAFISRAVQVIDERISMAS